MQSRWVGADGTRYLYCGYRFETTLAGRKSLTSSTATVVGRQTGGNYGGLYYTLHRHFDPVLMRWTSPDPAASPFYNLFGYCGNAPGAAYDPDGLFIVTSANAYSTGRGEEHSAKEGWVEEVRGWLNGVTDDLDTWVRRQCGVGALALGNSRFVPSFDQMGEAHINRLETRRERLTENGVSGLSLFLHELALIYGDVTPAGGWAEAAGGRSSVTGATLTSEQRKTAAVFATVDTALFLVGMRYVRSPGSGGTLLADTALGAGNSPEAMAMQGGRSYAVGSFTRVNITGNRVTALLPSKGGTGPLRWVRTNPYTSQLHAHPTTFYQLVDKDTGALLKWGITTSPHTRYSQPYLDSINGKLKEISTGSRRDMLRLEREHIRRIPGRLNHERFAGNYWRSGQ